MGQPIEPTPLKKDWLDVVAPVRKGAFREAAGGMFLLAAVALGGGVLILLTQPFWELSHRLPIPLGILAIIAIVSATWFVLHGTNVLRRTDEWKRDARRGTRR